MQVATARPDDPPALRVPVVHVPAEGGTGTWTATSVSETNLGPLDCYSQKALDECSQRTERPPAEPCEPADKPRKAMLFVGMMCKNCFTDCYCRGVVSTLVCR